MKKLLIIVAALLSMSAVAMADDLDGHKLYDIFSYEQIVARFGKPMSYECDKTDNSEYYVYEGLSIRTCESRLDKYDLTRKGVKVLTTKVKGGVQIGDRFSLLSALKPDKECKIGTETTVYDYWFGKDDICVSVFVKDGKITKVIGELDTL